MSRPLPLPVAVLAGLAVALAGAPPGRAADPPAVQAPAPRATAPVIGRAWLGCSAVALERAGDAGREGTLLGGVTVTAVAPGGPAARAGVTAGDVIVALDETPVLHPERLARELMLRHPGTTVRIVVLRDEKPRVLSATLATAPAVAARAERRVLGRVLAGGDAGAGVSLRFAGDRQRPWLGVAALPLTEQLATFFGATGGVLVETVFAHSPAARAGLAAGDVIIEVDGRSVGSPTSLQEQLVAHQPGDRLALTVLRGDLRLERVVTLEARAVPTWVFRPGTAPADAPAAPAPPGRPGLLPEAP